MKTFVRLLGKTTKEAGSLTVISLKKTIPQMVAMRAGQVVTMGNVIGYPSATLATNQTACAIPQRAPLNKAGKRAVPFGIHGLFLLQIAKMTNMAVEVSQMPTKLAKSMRTCTCHVH